MFWIRGIIYVESVGVWCGVVTLDDVDDDLDAGRRRRSRSVRQNLYRQGEELVGGEEDRFGFALLLTASTCGSPCWAVSWRPSRLHHHHHRRRCRRQSSPGRMRSN